jgi:uncharacterized protein
VKVAEHIGIPLKIVSTKEGDDAEYIANRGNSCFVCKSHLYSSLKQVGEYASTQESPISRIVLFNGTNKDDTHDNTRVGLVAARVHAVASPLIDLTKNEVRELALELSLPNHHFAASPCLRSRLFTGVQATKENLERVEYAESIVRERIPLAVHNNFRVRHLLDGGARVEFDEEILKRFDETLPILAEKLAELGYSSVNFGVFKSGNAAAAQKLPSTKI